MPDLSTALTTFATEMVGLSVAAERVTETLKQLTLSMPKDVQQAARRSWIVQLIAILSGVLVAGISGLNPLGVPNFDTTTPFSRGDWLCWILTGLLVSGGSAFWNHLLDILKSAKIQKEANADVAAKSAGQAPIPS